jgi:phosphatidylglycerophosphatase C
MPEVKAVAAFDFDGTLTRHDTLLPFLLRCFGILGLSRAMCLSAPQLLGFALGRVSNHQAKARLLEVSFQGRRCDELQRCADSFVKEALPGMWLPWGLEQLLMHQRLGHVCVLVSASPDIYLRQTAARLNFDALICTEMEQVEGKYTGQMATLNCHGEEKVRRLKHWISQTLGDENQATLYAYGDTRGDLPMLDMAQHAFYRCQPWRTTKSQI